MTNRDEGFTEARRSLYERFADRISTEDSLSRKLISYQGNKHAPGLRWFKYKEGFSSELVRRLLARSDAKTLLDPFSGSGTAPLTASSLGIRGTGIEIMLSATYRPELLLRPVASISIYSTTLQPV